MLKKQTLLWNRTAQSIRSMKKYTPWCYFICFGSIAFDVFSVVGLLMELCCETKSNYHCIRCIYMSKENISTLVSTFFIYYFYHFSSNLVSVSQHFRICWKYYCIHVKNYFLLSFLSVVCHLKLSYHHFASCSHVFVCMWVFVGIISRDIWHIAGQTN